VNLYSRGDSVLVDLAAGKVFIKNKELTFAPLPEKLLQILNAGGLVESIKNERCLKWTEFML
jgi:3-isopropylmalate dehydratase small subunit